MTGDRKVQVSAAAVVKLNDLLSDAIKGLQQEEEPMKPKKKDPDPEPEEVQETEVNRESEQGPRQEPLPHPPPGFEQHDW